MMTIEMVPPLKEPANSNAVSLNPFKMHCEKGWKLPAWAMMVRVFKWSKKGNFSESFSTLGYHT